MKRKPIPKPVRFKVYEKYNGHCAYCGCELELKDMQVDHIESVYWYNGANDIENYNPACRMCNFYKSTMPIEDFRKQLGKLTSGLKDIFAYRLAKKYGLIQEVEKPVKFYFEKGGQPMNDYKTRLLSEYKELVDRISKLRVFLNKWDNGQLSFVPKPSRAIYPRQLEAMCTYKICLESRMLTDRISFKEVENV